MWTARSTYQKILVLIILYVNGVLPLSDKRLCADPNCQAIISLGKAKVTYAANEEGRISFKINSPIRVKSKSAGSDPSLWGIEVNGRTGYAPREFILEEKIYVKDKDVSFEVPVEPVGRQPVKQDVDIPSPKLNPSEVIIEEKVSTTGAPATVPLDSATETTPSPLNGSESEIESTTAPLTVEDSKIESQSLQGTVTPVLSAFEVIDGTTIPIVENISQKAPIAISGNNSNEQASATFEPTKLKESKTTKQATVEQVNSNESINKNESTKDTSAETILNVLQPEEPAKIAREEAESIDVEKVKTISHQAKEVSSDTLQDVKVNPAVVTDTKVNAEPTTSKSEEPHQIPKEVTANSEAVAGVQKNSENSHLTSETSKAQTGGSLTKEKNEDVRVAQKVDNAAIETTEQTTKASSIEAKSVSDIPPAAVQPESSPSKTEKEELLQGNADMKKQDAEVPNATGFFNDSTSIKDDSTDKNDEDDDEDDDDENEDDEEHNINISFANGDLTTQKTIQEFTESGYETMAHQNYWEGDENLLTTTPSPKIVVETPTTATTSTTTPPTTTTPPPSTTTTTTTTTTQTTTTTTPPTTTTPTTTKDVDTESKDNAQTTTVISDAKVDSKETSRIEATETAVPAPQVPPVPSTLPIFQQPTVPPVYQQNEKENYAVYENPNDYYREQAISAVETKTAELLPSYSSADLTAPLSSEQYSTGNSVANMEDNSSEEHNIQKNDKAGETNNSEGIINKGEDSDTGRGTVEMVPNVSPSPEQNTEIPAYMSKEEKREAGLFTTILGTVNTFVSKLHKEPQKSTHDNDYDDEKLQHILYPERFAGNKESQHLTGEQYCEKLSAHQCPNHQHMESSPLISEIQCNYEWSQINMDNFLNIILAKAFEMREFLCCLTIAASACLLFLFGYYCFCNSNRESTLISKLNQLERSLLASHKENAILKDDLLKTRCKLTSIEDNTFGSNDMVIAVKKELEVISAEKHQLQEHVHSLEKELETAAEAGLELNKIVAELLNNQSGQESMIMSSVEDLQMQFNEQQKIILEINSKLAEKSRENSELQLMLAEQNVRFNGEIASIQQDNDELEAEKANLQTRIEELKTEFEEDIKKELDGKNAEVKRLQNEITEMKNRFEDIHTKWQTSLAKIEALEDCMKTMKKDPSVNICDVINVANVKAELLDLQKQRMSLKSLLETETEARQHTESSLKNAISEVDRLKQDFHQSEKDKLEAQTRLEVLSNYFKEKETQLQKELSLKEAIWLKQQGENTSTVDRVTAMQEEIHSLKSQNDALRAEIEAQIAAHKAQTGTLENRAHETWLAARQSERRYEEARAEAAALRRRLTELAGTTNPGDLNRTAIDSKMAAVELTNAPSPIMPPPLLDTAGSPLLGRLPPPQFMPFMGPPPPPFLNLPPPSFLSSVEMRPAPLGRMMSPPLGRYSPPVQRSRDRRNYYDDDYDYDDDDYDVEEDDYDYDDDEDTSRRRRHRRRSGNGSDNWRRDDYSPPPPDRSYRSHSPADSRYNYTAERDAISTYETDLSPTSSPPARAGVTGNGSRTGAPNSDSDKSYNSTHHKKKGKLMV